MFDYKLLFLCIRMAFSLKRTSLRFPVFRRIFFVSFVFPVLLLHIIFTWAFLWLDELIVPGFKKITTDKSIFIIAKPRSGTSFLLKLFNYNNENVTSFSLWEMMFAPSIIQKYFFILLRKIDRRTGNLMKRSLIFFSRKLFQFNEGIHSIRIEEAEEDETIFMYLFRSKYLTFVFPELEKKHDLYFRDRWKGTKHGERMMRFYKKCVQRHLYVYDRERSKYFVSKNPCWAGMSGLLSTTFPQSYFVNIERELSECISSTIGLTKNLWSSSCNVEKAAIDSKKFIEIVVTWDNELKKFMQNGNFNSINFSFTDLTKSPSGTMRKISEFTRLPIEESALHMYSEEEVKSVNYKSTHSYSLLNENEISLISSRA